MAWRIYEGKTTAVSQVNKVTVAATTHANASYKVKLTDETGEVITVVNYQTTAITSTSQVAKALTSSWNKSGLPNAAAITAATTNATVKFTADTAGAPFTLSTCTSNGASLTPTGTTTSNSGPHVYNLAGNWQGGTAPAANDDVRIPPGAPSILYGLANSATSIDSFRVEEGYTGNIGGTDGGYLRIKMGTGEVFEFSGGGKSYIDMGGSDISPIVSNTAAAAAGEHGLYFKGTAISNFYLKKGNVRFGEDSDTTSRCDVFHVSFIDDTESDAHLTIGGAISDVAGTSFSDINQTGGVVEAFPTGGLGTLTMTGGVFRLERGCGIAKASTIRGPGTLEHNSNGTVASLTISDGASYLNEKDTRSKTVTSITSKSDGVSIVDSFHKVNFGTGPVFDGVDHSESRLNFGPNATFSIS